MKISVSILLLAAAAFLSPPRSASAGEAPALAPDFTLADSSGKEVKLSSLRGKYVVLEWVNFDCPFVKKQYGPGAMQRRQAAFRDEGVVWLSICSSSPGKQGHLSGKALTARLEKEKWAGDAYLIDADGKVGKAYGAKTTPHVYIVDPKGKLIYKGGIDSIRSADPGDIFVATNYVVETLGASFEDRAVPHPSTSPYGCSVKY